MIHRTNPRILCAFSLLATLALGANASAQQECRRTCMVGEVRNEQGCCSAAPQTTPEVQCPSGTTWNAGQRACVGRRTCPSGSHSSGGSCVIDAVACPVGSTRTEGQCISQRTCPPGARLESDRCVSDVTCPTGTTFTNGSCLSQDVRCPEGTTRREGVGCVAPPTCPEGAQYTEGRGCVGAVTCPALTHLEGQACVPDHVCLDGEQWLEGRCQAVCNAIAHSRWDGERRACVCVEGHVAEGGACVFRTDPCPSGAHTEAGHCVADVVCPERYTFEPGRGCIDPTAERRARDERELAAREERERLENIAREERERAARRWSTGPGVQIFAGGGYQFVYMPNAYRAVARRENAGPTGEARGSFLSGGDGAAVWNGPVATGGLTGIFGDFAIHATYSYAPGSAWSSGSPSSVPCTNAAAATPTELSTASWCIVSSPMHLAMLDVGQQSAGPRHTLRFGLGFGWEFASGSFATQINYRSSIRIVGGLFVAIEAHLMGMVRLLNGGQNPALRESEVVQTPTGYTGVLRSVGRDGMAFRDRDPRITDPMDPNATVNTTHQVEGGTPPLGGGGSLQLFLGYSIY